MKKWILIGGVLLLAGCAEQPTDQAAESKKCERLVEVSVVNHASDKTLYEKDMCLKKSETALDALEETDLPVVKTGKGEMAYVTAVDGIREKSAGASSGWVFGVNDKPAQVGAGAYQLKDGDRLEWRFEKDAMAYFQ
ncbi:MULTISPECIES: DUF4430 domain-containing protein [unclassified Exiguobacterium]|uniref:DUF4430 domain-containing protein n=1 Tax=unclassified Exiguobacterium TaxID=2644629 RepID=UPI00299E27A8|nr:DUF4430 domain-containing protein [Exiguobacterium sp. K1]MDX1259945.1 DUF4430 domain-containing protein [Exiguobacterium sp. K1]